MMSNTKTNARILAMQSLYKYFHQDSKYPLSKLMDSMLTLAKQQDYIEEISILSTKSFKLSKVFYTSLVVQTIENMSLINSIILNNLDKGNDLTALDPVLYAILLVAVCEIQFFKDTPNKVIINEYTNIAGAMLNKADTGFINFILDKITKEIRHEQ